MEGGGGEGEGGWGEEGEGLPFSSDDSDGSSSFLSHGVGDGWRRLKSRCQAGDGCGNRGT